VANRMENETLDQIPAITLELDWYAEQDVVSVNPRDQRRFEIQKDRAIEILQKERERETFQKQFSLLLEHLAQWIRERRGQIEGSYLTLQDGALALVIVKKDVKYDDRFEDELSDLEFQVANDPDLRSIELTVLAVPPVGNDALRAFLDERLVLKYHGKPNGPHSTGEPQP